MWHLKQAENLSLPLRKCGLKFPKASGISILSTVTSLAEVWIEILKRSTDRRWSLVTSLAEVWIEIEDEALEELERIVTSLAEVWIEIPDYAEEQGNSSSLPLRKCGLKYKINKISQYIGCHFPCGSVD